MARKNIRTFDFCLFSSNGVYLVSLLRLLFRCEIYAYDLQFQYRFKFFKEMDTQNISINLDILCNAIIYQSVQVFSMSRVYKPFHSLTFLRIFYSYFYSKKNNWNSNGPHGMKMLFK